MKFIFSLLLLGISYSIGFSQINNYEKEWAHLDTLEHFRKMPEAIKAVKNLIQKTLVDSSNPVAKAHYIKAFIYKTKYEIEQEFKANRDDESNYCYLKELDSLSRRLQQQIEKTKDPIIKAMFHYCIADLLMQYRQDYYTCNRILQRARATRVRAIRADEFDEVRYIESTDPYQDSIDLVLNKIELQIADQLLLSTKYIQTQKIEAKNFSLLLKNADKLDTLQFHFSLYDMLLDNAIWYLDKNNQYLPYKETYTIFPYRDSLAFVSVENFIAFDFTVEDPYELRFKAYKLYQKLLKAHLRDEKKDILAKFDFERVLFAYKHGSQKINQINGFFLDCLEKLEKRYADVPYSTSIAYSIGNSLINEGYYSKEFRFPNSRWNLRRAYDLCTAAIKRHPNSVGAKNCQIVINKILQKEMRMELESVTPIDKAILIKVQSKNIADIHYKLLPLPADYHQKKAIIHNWEFKLNKDSAWAVYINNIDDKTATRWSTPVPNSGDFRTHSVEYAIPKQKAGAYLLMLSEKEDFAFDSNGVIYAYFQVSDLAFIIRERKLVNHFDEFFVVNRNNGAPRKDVKVTFYDKNYRKIGTTRSSDQGHFSAENLRNYYTVKLEKGDDYLHLQDLISTKDYSNDQEGYKNYFFIDKAIYRPGQTLQYKGVLTEFKYNGLNNVIPNQKTKITFYDVNGQEVASEYVVTNQYGSYSGNFDIPVSGLLGRMSIYDSLTESSQYFNVEEYKKPTFEITITPSWQAGKTKDTLVVLGDAFTFSKMPLAGALVKYTILRDKASSYSKYGYYRVEKDTIEVANTVVDAQGNYLIVFETDIIKDTLLTGHNYHINADIIDLSGETHSIATSYYHSNPNYRPWQTKMDRIAAMEETTFSMTRNYNKQIKRDEKSAIASFTAIATKGDGTKTPEPISGTWTIEQLETPEFAQINRFWSLPDTAVWSAIEFQNLFPLYDYKKYERAESNWTILDTIFTESFENISEFQLVVNTKKWAKGRYRITFRYTNRAAEVKMERKYFSLDDQLPIPAYNKVIDVYSERFEKDQLIGEPGDTILLPVGSYFEDAHVLLELENYRRVHEYRWVKPNRFEELPIILEEKHRGNLHFRLLSVYNNRLSIYKNKIEVPWSNKELEVEYLTFRDNLLPGQKEEWTLKIKGNDGKAMAAEVLASMYDAALDKLKPHYWNLDVFSTSYRHSLRDWSVQANMKDRDFQVNAYPNWQLKIPAFQSSVDPSLANPNSFLFFNEIWYMQNPNSNDWDGDGVPNDKDEEPFSKPGIQVNSNGVSIEKLRLLEEQYDEEEAMKIMQMSESARGQTLGAADIAKMATRDISSLKATTAGISADSMVAPPNLDETDFGDVKVRADLKETVFFYPHLTTADDGTVSIKFTMSEALSKWKLMIATHGKEMESVVSTKTLISQKKLMVMPSTPRFLRQGDEVEISSKISNLSEEELAGKITLQLFYADSEEAVDNAFGNDNNILDFSLQKGAVSKVSWRLKIPEEWTKPILYRIIAKAGNFSDGEQNSLPVMSNKILVTESMPVLVHGKSKQDFIFNSLKNNDSKTLKHHQLTLELTPNPAWDAVLSLPYMMEYPYECSEQLFSRFYSNSLATQIVNSNPKIKSVFDDWASTTIEGTSLDKLLANPSLKSALLEETPWVLAAKDDRLKKKQIGQLFDMSKMSKEFVAVRDKLVKRQAEDGGFAWFDGGRSSSYITQYIVAGFGKLSRLGANPLKGDAKTSALFNKAVTYMDQAFIKRYQYLIASYDNKEQRKKGKNAIMLEDNLDYESIQYLYAKSFFWNTVDIEKDSALTATLNFYLKQASFHWQNKSMYHQGMIALALHRMNGESKLSMEIVDSLRSKAIVDKNKGMSWPSKWGYYWYQLPIETQALMIEVFSEVAQDEKAVYLLKLWLLQNKRGAAWASTKATTTASYALLMTGGDWLNEGEEILITMGGEQLSQESVKKEEGTGYFQMTFGPDEITSEMATISFDNPNPSPAFGAVYWQYFEELDNIKFFKDTPLKIKKELFLEENTKEGTKQTAIAEAKLKPGDLIKVRIILVVENDMEYVHMKDMRAAGFEPINVLSGYKYQNGLGFYESTRDASTNFFFDYIKKGRYVFEYPLRVNHKGEFSNGITTIQSMYAPEYTGHSESVRVTID